MHFLNKVWNVKLNLNIGYSFMGFALGFSITRYSIGLDLGFFWISLEW